MILKFIKFLFLIFFLLYFGEVSNAADYYWSTTGNDSDPGTAGQPFLTPQRCVNALTSPGDRCLGYDGTYTTPVLIDGVNGSAESPIAITNVTQALPAVVTAPAHGFSNGDIIEIEGLTNYLTTGMQQLFNQWFLVANVTTDTFELNTLDGIPLDSQDYDPYINGGTAARIHPITFKSINPSGVVLDTSTTVTGWSNSGQSANNYLSSPTGLSSSTNTAMLWRTDQNTSLIPQTSAGAVTAEGSFFFDSVAKTFLIHTSGNPNSRIYKGYDRNGTSNINIINSSYLLLENFISQYSDVPIYISVGNTHILNRYTTAQYSARLGAVAVQSSSATPTQYVTNDHITIQYASDCGAGCTGINYNGHGIKFAANADNDNGQYVVVSNSTLHDIMQTAIQFSNGWTHGYFWGNHIYNYSLRGSSGGLGIRSGVDATGTTSKDAQIFDNDIGGTTIDGSGIGLGAGSIGLQFDTRGVNIFRNRLHGNVWHGIYLFSSPGPSNILIFNNLIYNNSTSGIRSDYSVAINGTIKIYNNSFYANGEASISGVGATISLPLLISNGFSLYNNIIQNTNAQLIYASTTYHLYPSDYNLFYRSAGFSLVWNGVTYTSLAAYTAATILRGFNPGLDSHSLVGDPLYANPALADFRIPSPTTPADASGINLISTIPTDYSISSRNIPFDIGAWNTQGNLLVSPSAVLSSPFPGRVVSITFGFATSALAIQKDWKIIFTMPSDFILNSSGVTSLTSSSGMDGSFTVNVNGQVITVARNNDGTVTSAPGTFSFTLNHIKNPVTSGLTGTFGIAMTDVNNVEVAEANNAQGIVISDVAPSTYSGMTVSGALIK